MIPNRGDKCGTTADRRLCLLQPAGSLRSPSCEIFFDFLALYVGLHGCLRKRCIKPSWFLLYIIEGSCLHVSWFYFSSHFHAFDQACSFVVLHSLLPFVSIILVGYLFVHSAIVVHILRIVLGLLCFRPLFGPHVRRSVGRQKKSRELHGLHVSPRRANLHRIPHRTLKSARTLLIDE